MIAGYILPFLPLIFLAAGIGIGLWAGKRLITEKHTNTRTHR